MRLGGLPVAVLIFQDWEFRQGASQGRVYLCKQEISSPSRVDRIVQNSMVDSLLYPFFVARSVEGTKVSRKKNASSNQESALEHQTALTVSSLN